MSFDHDDKHEEDNGMETPLIIHNSMDNLNIFVNTIYCPMMKMNRKIPLKSFLFARHLYLKRALRKESINKCPMLGIDIYYGVELFNVIYRLFKRNHHPAHVHAHGCGGQHIGYCVT